MERNIAWSEISGFSKYMVSENGDVKNKKTGKILKRQYSVGGYVKVTLLGDDQKAHFVHVHILVAQIFVPNPNSSELTLVNHKDEDRTNCKACNLEWVSPQLNVQHGKCREKIGKSHEKPVSEYSCSGQYLRTWKSARAIARYYGFGNSTVSHAISKNVCCANHYFRFWNGSTDDIDVNRKENRKLTRWQNKMLGEIPIDDLFVPQTDEEILSEIQIRESQNYVPYRKVLEDILFLQRYIGKLL